MSNPAGRAAEPFPSAVQREKRQERLSATIYCYPEFSRSRLKQSGTFFAELGGALL
ncbi:hypothetical protein [Baaleninema simplex]|uniref:hypothetical protein n=1 Tax=Baaleninema simplex TaxID=2862350 RepID=UPI000347E617|nr:hypothetical protein [Baaleninema simplex]